MAITAQNIIDKAQIILQDTGAVRWTEEELLGWLNDAQREVCTYKPDACVVNSTLTCASGSKQSLPAGGLTLISVIKNGLGTAVRLIDKRILDDQIPDWHNKTGVTSISHYCFDPRNQKNFYVYPPATTQATLEIVYAASPSDMSANTALGAQGVVDEIYANSLMDYILFRAYSKDADYAADDSRASAHYNKFVQAMVGKERGEAASEATAILRRANSASVQAVPQIPGQE